ncbi:pantetheine-phosphate adenylyltransferase [Roseimarinus sediminis]|jgi:pantetheine-phosphate adenylyltransferase|uniref:pantetheine-phosphate adenylyltransferase n=1 Tax=Roseimarinus sediminis TaxID=1610899 RepID=UPI003D21F1D3
MEKVAVFPGSFDPFTIGHESVLKRALPLFDKIIVMLGVNDAKKYLFPIEVRKQMIETLFAEVPAIEVSIYNGLTVDFCKQVGATHILRGLRTAADFEYERAIAQVNKKMYNNIETVFLLTLPEHTPVNSSVVRDILKHKGDISMFIPDRLDIKKYLGNDND